MKKPPLEGNPFIILFRFILKDLVKKHTISFKILLLVFDSWKKEKKMNDKVQKKKNHFRFDH